MTILIVFLVVPTLWVFSDTITEFLSKGKSFVPNELKPFK